MTTTPAARRPGLTARHRAAAAAVLAAALLAVPANSARAAAGSAADTSDTSDTPADQLLLTVSGAQNTWIRGVALTCPPAADTPHPHAAEACAELAATAGDLDTLPSDANPCPMIYNPVTATADGTFDGRPVAWQRTYPNSCFMEAATGPVFRF